MLICLRPVSRRNVWALSSGRRGWGSRWEAPTSPRPCSLPSAARALPGCNLPTPPPPPPADEFANTNRVYPRLLLPVWDRISSSPQVCLPLMRKSRKRLLYWAWMNLDKTLIRFIQVTEPRGWVIVWSENLSSSQARPLPQVFACGSQAGTRKEFCLQPSVLWVGGWGGHEEWEWWPTSHVFKRTLYSRDWWRHILCTWTAMLGLDEWFEVKRAPKRLSITKVRAVYKDLEDFSDHEESS